MLNIVTPTQRLLTNIERSAHSSMSHDIVRLTLPKATLAAISEWRSVLDRVYECAGYGTALTLTDARRSTLPAMALVTHFSDLWSNHAHRRLHSRNVVLCSGCLPEGVEHVLSTLPGYGNNSIRFFAPTERDLAMRWLLSDD